jgi:cytochrome P450
VDHRTPSSLDACRTIPPTRRPNDHLAFGGYGTHFCLGASLALLELRVMFQEMLARIPGLERAEGDAPGRPSNFIVGLEELPVRLP